MVLWDSLVQHSFRAEIDFKVNHVMLVGDDKASFKTYISSCKLVEVPKLAISETRQAQEAYTEKIKESVRKSMAGGGGAAASAVPTVAVAAAESPSGDPTDDEVDPIKVLALKAASASAPVLHKTVKPAVVVASSAPAVVVASSARKVKKAVVETPPPPPPPVEEVTEEEVEDVQDSDDEPVPTGVIQKACVRRS